MHTHTPIPPQVKGEAKHGRRAQEDFATRGEALDQRTKLVLFKWQQVFGERVRVSEGEGE